MLMTRTATMRAAFIKCSLSVRHVSDHLKHVNALVLSASLQYGYCVLQHVGQRRNLEAHDAEQPAEAGHTGSLTPVRVLLQFAV